MHEPSLPAGISLREGTAMKRRVLIVLLGTFLTGLTFSAALHAQTCNDDEAMVKSYVQSLTNLVATVKKESEPDFERQYHQKATMANLGLTLGMIDGLLDCLDKAAKDPTATKPQTDSMEAKRQAYARLKANLERDQAGLKAAHVPKAAKALIEKFGFAA
jgi:hypothetical protein